MERARETCDAGERVGAGTDIPGGYEPGAGPKGG
jgi:hypothetical protein